MNQLIHPGDSLAQITDIVASSPMKNAAELTL